MELRAASIIDAEIEGHYAFFPFVEGISTREHQHDFYEIFLIAAGRIEHHINQSVQVLERGSLVFVRPDDAHFFSQHAEANCELINLAFLSGTFAALSDFLGLEDSLLLSPNLAPMRHLSNSQNLSLQAQLRQWGRLLYQDKAQSRQQLRALLVSIISRYFITPEQAADEAMPLWLDDVVKQMNAPVHFIEGREALMRLANRSPEYVGRAFKQYLDVTPSQFINNLRLNYASDLLLHSDLSPTDICYDSGFGNLSYFYHLFKARWHCSPNQFRKQHQRTLIP